jgi:hypothetical protein
MGQSGNGLYGATTWDWFTDVDYHFDNVFLQPGDFDGNGTYELCNNLYEADCPNTGGLSGGCCGPCWGAPLGTILPGAWFAYGINGSCPQPGPPVRVDWGDGNTCGGGMGPWSFCFDLQVREYPDCLEDATTSDLSLGFITTADGETGSWTGNASVCALDQPAKITLPLKCGENIDLGTDVVDAICSGDLLIYTIQHPGVSEWNWTIAPGGFVQQPVYSSGNGYQIYHVVTNLTNTTQIITYDFIGRRDNSDDVYYKQLIFEVYPQIQFAMPDQIICERDSQLVLAPTITGGTGNYNYQWLPTGETTLSITLHYPFLPQAILRVNDEAGCVWSDTVNIKTRPCHLIDTIPPIDDDNEPDHPMDPPPPKEDFSSPKEQITNRSFSSRNMQVYPVPAQDAIVISWSDLSTLPVEQIIIADVNGQAVMQVPMSRDIRNRLKVDITSLPAGVYYVTGFSKEKVETAKMVKL